MTTGPLFDYNSRCNFDKINPLIRSVYNNGSDFEQYRQKLLEKVEIDNHNGQNSFLTSVEEIRREQRHRLAQVEQEYYKERSVPAFDVPFYADGVEKRTDLVSTKPPLPTTIRRSPSPINLDDMRATEHIHHWPISTAHSQNTTLSPSKVEYVEKRIETMWNEFDLDDYLEKRK